MYLLHMNTVDLSYIKTNLILLLSVIEPTCKLDFT